MEKIKNQLFIKVGTTKGKKHSIKTLEPGHISENRFSAMSQPSMALSSNNGDSKEPTKAQYPVFLPSARVRRAFPRTVVDIPPIPKHGDAPKLNWISILAAPVCMVFVMLIMAVLVGTNTMIYMLPMQLIGVTVSIVNYFTQRRAHKKLTLDTNSRYEEMLKNRKAILKKRAEEIRSILEDENPKPETCQTFPYTKDHLWEKTRADNDFLTVRIGIGTFDNSDYIKGPQKDELQEANELEDKARELVEEFREIKGCAVLCDLLKHQTTGIIGDREKALNICRELIMEIASLHSYHDVKIMMLYPENESDVWDAFRFLPHVFDGHRQERYMTCDRYEATLMLDSLSEILKSRLNAKKDLFSSSIEALPHYVVFIADPGFLQDNELIRLLCTKSDIAGVSTVFVYHSRAEIPSRCSQIVFARANNQNEIYDTNDTASARIFQSEGISVDQADQFSRALAPIRILKSIKESGLPNSITLLQAHGVNNPDSLDIIGRWKKNRAFKSMSVPIGVCEDGSLFYFDIHEKKCGPMGLIAGTTRSGKTDLLRTWIIEMAMTFSPEDVSFVLIDFKGSSLTAPFIGLPHLAGAISNLDVDPDRDDFILRYATSLKSEILRRQRVLRENGCDGDILLYHKRRNEGTIKEALPFLMIVIDEFAEIKSQYPDFMRLVESLYATGGSLGMYVLLATQHPSSVINDKIRANTSFRWCLRVESDFDSKEMLGIPDAARLAEIPGRGFVRVDKMRIHKEIQGLWCGAAYSPFELFKANNTNVAIVGRNGSLTVKKESFKKKAKEETEVKAIVRKLSGISKENRYAHTHRVWMDNLPQIVLLKDITNVGRAISFAEKNKPQFAIPVGLADIPVLQKQDTLLLNFRDNGSGVLYGAPQTGKTLFLFTLLSAMTNTYSPEEAVCYLIDYNSGGLAAFSEYPQTVNTCTLFDDEKKLHSLINSVEKEISKRRLHFQKNIASTDSEYGGKAEFPYVLLVIDGYSELRKSYADVIDPFLENLIKNGAHFGMYCILTASEERDTYRISGLIKPSMRFVLQMASKNEYGSILGMKGTTPGSFPGRGICRYQSSVVEFQTALPTENADQIDQMIEEIREKADQLKALYPNSSCKESAMLPSVIPYGSVDTGTIQPVLGLSKADLTPVIHDFTKLPALLITADSVSDCSKYFELVIRQITEMPMLHYAVGYQVKSIPLGNDEYDDPHLFEQRLNSVVQELKDRLAQWKDDHTISFDPISVFIQDLPALLQSVSVETKELLGGLLRVGKSASVYLVATGTTETIALLYNQREEAICRFFNRGIIVDGAKWQQESVFNQYADESLKKEALPFYLHYETEKGSMIQESFKAMESK